MNNDKTILNPDTCRCVKKDGKVGKEIIKKYGESISDCDKKKSYTKNKNTGNCDEKSKKKKKQTSSEKKTKTKSPKKQTSPEKKTKTKSPKKQISNITKTRDERLKEITKKLCVKRSELPLTDPQLKVVKHMENNDSLLVVHGTGCGKCHGKNTPILMYDGSIKMVQDVIVGDEVMGYNSKPRKVLSLARGKEEMFKIIQVGSGEDYIVNKSHILTLKINDKKGEIREKLMNNFYIDDDNIIDIPLTKYLELSDDEKSILKGFRVKIDFSQKQVKEDPYMIGLSSGNKFIDIPSNYIVNSEKNRVRLLEGVFDSKWCIKNGNHYDFYTQSEKNKKSIEYLIRSLGGKILFNEITKLSFSFSSSLKSNIYVENIGVDDYYGFELDGNHRYLLGDFTITHNTLTAITASQCFLDKYPKSKAVFIGPPSLINNFKKEMVSYGVENTEKYEYYSMRKIALRNKQTFPSMKGKFIIIDEAHNLRNPSTKVYKHVFDFIKNSAKRIVLTATPFVNFKTDIYQLVNLLYADVKLEDITKSLKGRIDIVDCKTKKDFAKRIDHYVEVHMTKKYWDAFYKLTEGIEINNVYFKDPIKFYNGFRRAVNKAGLSKNYFSQKVHRITEIIQNQSEYKKKSVIFTNWIDFGVSEFKEIFDMYELDYRIISGKVLMNKRRDILDEFNRNDFQILIITRAGGEGIDLKEVRNVFILDPPWNDSGLQQIIGRAIRFKSHKNLPKEQRIVDVYHMILVPPLDLTNDKNTYETYKQLSGDVILYDIIGTKKEEKEKLFKELEKITI